MKRFALRLPALLLSSVAMANQEVTYDIKIVEEGNLVYSFRTTAPSNKDVHFETRQIDHKDQDLSLDYRNRKITIDLRDVRVEPSGGYAADLSLYDHEERIETAPPGQFNMPKTSTNTVETVLSLAEGTPKAVSYNVALKGLDEKVTSKVRTLMITATTQK